MGTEQGQVRVGGRLRDSPPTRRAALGGRCHEHLAPGRVLLRSTAGTAEGHDAGESAPLMEGRSCGPSGVTTRRSEANVLCFEDPSLVPRDACPVSGPVGVGGWGGRVVVPTVRQPALRFRDGRSPSPHLPISRKRALVPGCLRFLLALHLEGSEDFEGGP